MLVMPIRLELKMGMARPTQVPARSAIRRSRRQRFDRPAYIEVRTIEDPTRPTIGVLLVTVLASPRAPHQRTNAFLLVQTTRVLSEHEVDNFYARRASLLSEWDTLPILSRYESLPPKARTAHSGPALRSWWCCRPAGPGRAST
jgi:hypothetical protein